MRNVGRGSRVDTSDGGGSFFTARATLRSLRADGTVEDEEVEVWIGTDEVSRCTPQPSLHLLDSCECLTACNLFYPVLS